MKRKEVLEILKITPPTLTKYVKQGLVKVDSEINGQYIYNDDSVYELAGVKTISLTELAQGRVVDKTTAMLETCIDGLSACADIFKVLSKYNALPPEAKPIVQHVVDLCIELRAMKQGEHND